jgi:hypothetical protein
MGFRKVLRGCERKRTQISSYDRIGVESERSSSRDQSRFESAVEELLLCRGLV